VTEIQNYTSGRQYIIISAGGTSEVYNDSLPTHQYEKLYSFILSNPSLIQGNIKLWFSHIPSPNMTKILPRILAQAQRLGTRIVTLYFENLIYPLISDTEAQRYPLSSEVNHSVFGAMSCLECLVDKGYTVGDWNWHTFAEDTSSPSCEFYTEMYSNQNYRDMKAVLDDCIKGQPNSSFKIFCC